MTKHLNTQSLLWLALVLALLASLKHLTAVFASVDGDYATGLLQALAIDAGIFALAYSIKPRKQAKRSVWPLWIGLAMFTTISVYGNLFYGIMQSGASLPSWMLAIKPYVLAGSLPILVLFLSELLASNRAHQQKQQEKLAKKTNREPTVSQVPANGKLNDSQMLASREQFACDQCSEAYDSYQALNAHKRKHKPVAISQNGKGE